jgi:hypothetical protein
MTEQMDRKEYLEERRLLATLESESYKSFDKALLSFSSGAIALSVAFIERFSASCNTLLVLSWILWTISITAQLISYIISAKAVREEMRILNEQYKDYSKEAVKNIYVGLPTKLNIAALLSFLIGVICFLIFILINIQ